MVFPHALANDVESPTTSSGKCAHSHRLVPKRFVVEAVIALTAINFTMVSWLAASSSDQ